MKGSARATLAIGITLWVQSGFSATLKDTYTTAKPDDKLIICAPILTKGGGVLELMADKAADKGEALEAKQMKDIAFLARYRGRVLQTIGESKNPTLLDKAWNLSAERENRSSYPDLIKTCMTLYDEQKKAGKISREIEAKSIKKVQQGITSRSNIPEIPVECRGTKSSNVDLCAQARAAADDMAKLLPMHVSQNLTLMTVFAIGKRVTVTALLAYNRQFLESYASANAISMKSVDSAMVNMAKSGACSQIETKSFIENGGSLQYLYRFMDGTSYLNPVVSSCR